MISTSHFALGQAEDPDGSSISHAKSHEDKRNKIIFNYAYSYIPQGAEEDNLEEGHFVPSIGLDYFRVIHPRWELGILLDYELATYIIPRKENLKRDRAFLIIPGVGYTILNGWNLFAGAGIELERHKNLFVVRLGTDYTFQFRKGWGIPIGMVYDIKEGYDVWSLAVGISKSF